jgi:hypothetical protein
VGVVRPAITLAALVAAAATCAAPATAAPADWRAAGNSICVDYFDALAIYTGEISEEDATPALLREMAQLTDRKDARLAKLSPPAAKAADFKRMVAFDRSSARDLRKIAKSSSSAPDDLSDISGFETLFKRYEHDSIAYAKLARKLGLGSCAGSGGDIVTGPAAEL